MYASLTTTTGNAEDMLSVAQMAGETMAEWLRDVEKYKEMVMLTNEETGTTHVITFWTDEETAERSRVARLSCVTGSRRP